MKKKADFKIKDFGILIFFIGMFVILSIIANNFCSVSNVINVLNQVAVTGMVAVGVAMTIMTGGIDLSVGSVVASSGIITAFLMVTTGFDPILASIIGMLSGAAVGMVNGWLISFVNIPPLITTLATMTGVRGICYIITQGIPIFGFPPGFSVLGQGHLFDFIPIPVVFMVAIFIIGWIILSKFPIGRYIYGIGGNEEAVRLSGINTKKVKFLIYSISGLLTGFAGVVFLSRVNSAMPSSATGFEMDVITAVVLGGVSISGGEGKLRGVVIGVLLVGFLMNGLIIMGVPDYFQYIVRCVVLLLAVSLEKIYKIDLSKKRKMLSAN